MSLKLRQSSLTKKILVACAGFFMITFLPVHLATNLLLLPIFPNHEQMFREMVHFLGTFPVIKIVEVVLFLAIAVHVCYTMLIHFQNRKARPVRYKKAGRSERTPFSRFMIHTGLCIGLFLIIHFINFYFVKLGFINVPEGAADKEDFYNMAYLLFQSNFYCILYIIFLIPIGFHLDHAFQSVFQTLGIYHPIYTPVIKVVGHIYAIVITVGFISIPYFFLMKNLFN